MLFFKSHVLHLVKLVNSSINASVFSWCLCHDCCRLVHSGANDLYLFKVASCNTILMLHFAQESQYAKGQQQGKGIEAHIDARNLQAPAR